MTTIKRREVLVPAVLLLVGALAAIWWFVAVRDQGADELLYGACQDISAEESYDLTTSIVGPWSFTPEIITTYIAQVRVSGDDYHLTMTHDDPKNNYEIIVLDDIEYIREREGQFLRGDDLPFPLDSRPFMRSLLNIDNTDGPISLCPPENADIMGQTEHEGIPVLHLRLVKTGDALMNTAFTRQQLDYWVGPEGRLVKTRQVLTYDVSPEIKLSTFEFFATVSGVGEPNVITAPLIPVSTPTP